MIISNLILHPQQDQGGAGDADRKAHYVEDAETPVFPEISDRGRQIISEHMAYVYRSPGQPNASFAANSFSTPYLGHVAVQCPILQHRLSVLPLRSSTLSKKTLFYSR
jgi:hypothetical protein